MNSFDLRVAQDIFVKSGSRTHKLQVEASFLNIGNLFNSSWGVAQTNSVSNYGKLLKYEGQDKEGFPTFSMNGASEGKAPTETFTYNKNYGQAWSMQLGLRYYFD